MGNLINDNLIPTITATNFWVESVDGIKAMFFDSEKAISNLDYYAEYLLGECSSCDNKDYNIIKTLYPASYTSVLVGGLGLGLIPQYLHTKGKSVDVIEIDSELIDYVDFIDPSINIIEGDVYNYNTSNKYDIIVIDLWWDKNEITEKNKTDLLENWSDNLNEGGKIILPVSLQSLS
jgi:hypothetical protein